MGVEKVNDYSIAEWNEWAALLERIAHQHEDQICAGIPVGDLSAYAGVYQLDLDSFVHGKGRHKAG